jgi:sugar phosphate isomerase/epimerase
MGGGPNPTAGTRGRRNHENREVLVKLGLLTACLPDFSLEQVAAYAEGIGLEALEVAAWPETGGRPFTASHLKVVGMTDSGASAVREMLAAKGLTVSGIAYYDNNLHPDPRERHAINQHLLACVDAAALLGCPVVGTFVGRDPSRTVSENLREAEQVFPPLVAHAGERRVHLVIENCPMEGWHPDGYPGNLAYSPELWEWMFSLGLYLNYDPSHLLWLGIDPVEAVRPYVDKVLHAQAKDIELFPERRNRYGYPGKARDRRDPWDVGWWRYRVPGCGQVDWQHVTDVLYEGGFDGTISIEHEDPVWGGSEESIKTGVQIAERTLRSVLAPRRNPRSQPLDDRARHVTNPNT